MIAPASNRDEIYAVPPMATPAHAPLSTAVPATRRGEDSDCVLALQALSALAVTSWLPRSSRSAALFQGPRCAWSNGPMLVVLDAQSVESL